MTSQDNSSAMWLSGLAGAIVGTWVIFQSHGVINNDGVLYIEAARHFSDGSWHEGLSVYRWPFYSLLIALVHQLTSLPLQLSAHAIAVACFSATCIGIATLTREIGGDNKAALFASLLLIASPYLVGNILPSVVRDHGSWACQIWSIIFLLRYMRNPGFKNAIAWGLLATMAVLFRIEAITFLILLPLLLLIPSAQPLLERVKLLVKCQAVLVTLTLGLLAILTFSDLKFQSMGRLHEPLKVAGRIYQNFSVTLEHKAEIMGQEVLGNYLDDYASPILLFGLLYILLFKAATVAGWLQLGLALLSRVSGFSRITPDGKQMLIAVSILGMVNGACILMSRFILPGRMLAPIGFVVIILAAFGLARLMQLQQEKSSGFWKKNAFAIAMLLTILQVVATVIPDGENKKKQKTFEIEAARWIAENTPSGSKILYGSERLSYYAGDFSKMSDRKVLSVLNSDEILGFDFVVMRTGHYKSDVRNTVPKHPDKAALKVKKYQLVDEPFLTEKFGAPAASFDGGRNNKVLIYKIVRANASHFHGSEP